MKDHLYSNKIDSFLIILLMLSIISPIDYAKLATGFSTFIILIVLFKDKKIFFDKYRLLIFILLLPGIILTIINYTQELIRFFIILIILFKFPFKFRPNLKLVWNFSFGILFYLIITQILIAYGNEWFISFRNNWYQNEFSYIFEMGTIKSIISSLGSFRAGGLFHNPNVLGLVVLLYYIIFDQCHLNLEKKNNLIYLFITSITIFSLLLAFSRTAIAGFFIYYLIKKVSFKKLLFLKVEKKNMLLLLLALLVTVYIFDNILEGLSSSGSAGLKYNILITYLKSADLISILFGGQHDAAVMFDADLSNWIGAVGFIGIVGIILLFRRIVTFNKNTLPLIVALTFMSIGNTALYGLLSASIIFCYFLIISDKKIKN